MATLTLDLAPELYARLRAEARQLGQPVEVIAQAWLVERLTDAPAPATSSMTSDRERATEILRAAGLLTELSPWEKARARHSRATLEQVSAALSRPGSKPLSERILELRGPNDANDHP